MPYIKVQVFNRADAERVDERLRIEPEKVSIKSKFEGVMLTNSNSEVNKIQVAQWLREKFYRVPKSEKPSLLTNNNDSAFNLLAYAFLYNDLECQERLNVEPFILSCD